MELPRNKLADLTQRNEKLKATPKRRPDIKTFTEHEIKRITKNYRTYIGKGAFGEVFRGSLDDGSPVAVKKFIQQNMKEWFDKEIAIHCQVNHKNIVKLLGYCSEENALMMVTEYIPRGDLKDLLHGSDHPISFGTRLCIAIDCAEALTCMHSMYPPIIHCDIKPDNILLDDNLGAKLSDFGISRLLRMENTYRTMNLIGSRGYMDPEHLETGRVDPKNDVYSFGVVLLELVTRATATQNSDLIRNFIEASVKNKYKFFEAFGKKNRAREMFDIQIANASNIEVLDKFGELAAECLRKDFRKRPEMKHVLERLRMLGKDHEKRRDRKAEKQQGVVPPDGNTAFSPSQTMGGLENERESSGESQFTHEEEEAVQYPPDGNTAFSPSQTKGGLENGRESAGESQFGHEEEEAVQYQQASMRRICTGNGPPESMYDWTHGDDMGGYWRLVTCQNGLDIFELVKEVDNLARSYGRAMKAVGVVEASCEAIFARVMAMDTIRLEWDCSFKYGSLVEEVDGHTAILYHRLHLDGFSTYVWPRDLCYVRYWRRNGDGGYDVLFHSVEHPNCVPQPGYVRAHAESGGFSISPLESRNGRVQSQVQHRMRIDMKGWGVGYLPSFQQHCLIRMMNSVYGLREWFSRNDESPPRRFIGCHEMMKVLREIQESDEDDDF